MNRITVILLAALDAVIALGVGVAVPLVPLTVMWGLQFDLSSDWLPFWGGGADIWLLGQGVDVTVTLDPTASATFGLSGTNVFTISTAALGLAVLTVFLGSRTGRRAWATPHALAAAISGIVTFAVLSALVTLSAHTGAVVPSLLQGAVLPACVFAVGIGIGIVAAELRDRADPARGDALGGEHPQRLPWPVSGWSPATRAVLAAILRGGMAASALVVAASAVFLTVLMVIGYGRIVGLYETLQPGVLGAGALTLAQLALLPNAVIWAASWLAGPGFAIGAGSSVDVAQTTLGPLPSVPLFGVLPQSDPGFGLAAVLVPVLCGAVAGFLLRRWIEPMSAAQAAGRVDGYRAGVRAGGVGGARGRLEHGIGGRTDGGVEWGAGRLTLVVLGMGACSGAVLGLLAWWSSGAIGPGRLQHAGPNPLLVAAAVAAEVVIGAGIGIAVRRESALEPGRIGARERRERRTFIAGQTALSSPAEPRESAAGGRRPGGRALAADDDDKDWIAALEFDDEPPAQSSRKTSRSTTTATRGTAAQSRAGSAIGRSALGGSAPGASGLGGSGLGGSGLGGSGLGGSGLVRPSAPRVPTPRGRLPKTARERDFAEPEFASHETSESDDR